MHGLSPQNRSQLILVSYTKFKWTGTKDLTIHVADCIKFLVSSVYQEYILGRIKILGHECL